MSDKCTCGFCVKCHNYDKSDWVLMDGTEDFYTMFMKLKYGNNWKEEIKNVARD